MYGNVKKKKATHLHTLTVKYLQPSRQLKNEVEYIYGKSAHNRKYNVYVVRDLELYVCV